MKKRVIALFLTAAMVLGSFTSCAPAKTEKPAEPAKAEAPAEPAKAEEPAAEPAKAEEPAAEPAAEPAETTDGGKILRLAITTEPPSLDQQLSTDAVSGEIMNGIYEGLIRNFEGKVLPGMAEKWDISPDGLTYTFHLRDANWSDGVPVKAQDFEYAFKRLLDPNVASDYAFQAYYIKGGEAYNTGAGTLDQVAVKAKDDKTFEVTLEVPTTYFLPLMGFGTFFPTRQDLVEKYKESYATDPDKTVYNGPYTLTEWEHEAQISIAKNPGYWNASAIKLDGVDMPVVMEAKTAVAMYEEGSLDYTGLGKDFVQKYKDAGLAQYYYDGAEMYFQINQEAQDAEKAKFLNNKNFRLALAYGVDRKLYIDTVLKNNSDPATRYNFKLLTGTEPGKKFTEQYPLDFYPESADKAKAQEYLQKAADELGVAVDAFPAFEYLTDDSQDVKIQAEAIQAMLKEIGVKMEIKQVPFKERLELMDTQQYEICGALWGPDFDDVMTFMDLWVIGGGHNSAKFNSQQYTDLVLGAKKEADAKKRGDMLFEAEKILLDESVIIPIYVRRRAYALNDKVQGMTFNFIGATRDFVFADIAQ